MDGIHDLGGKWGYGAVQDRDLPEGFAARWEAAVFASMRALFAAGVIANTDQFRHAIERIDPAAYLTHGYYGRWLAGLETLMLEAAVLTPEALDERVAATAAMASAARPQSDVPQFPPSTNPATSIREVRQPPLFALDATVRTLQHAVPGHTRLPAYARGRRGRVVKWHAGWVFPDSNASGAGEAPTHLYTVRFSARELWGEQAEAGVNVHLDLFEPYLQPAGGSAP